MYGSCGEVEEREETPQDAGGLKLGGDRVRKCREKVERGERKCLFGSF